VAVAERVLSRLQEQMAAEEVRVVAVGQVAGQPVLLVPHRAPGMDEQALPSEYRKLPEVVHDADEPVVVKDVCRALDVGIEARHTEAMRSKLNRLAERGWLRKRPTGRFTHAL
jgi:hypothetical protein